MGQVKTVMLNQTVNKQRETFATTRRCTAENKGNKKQKSTSNNN